ncbi:helix-turn-helix domain-containing protein [Rhodococcus sp. H29-C3]|uniref:helix-turn-helix domain-containing protein n=1 Tax=Rhodococcus sp. H29-C3 TaxID=3046307 RepID=UPI0024B8B699|nr:helix-turn-helix domain-containing protein [Rhodococcus sp. H29-C3]MDJ0363107.1 helix-turn-helix domain-containing protein [Rhodococcus sp. H29-C3]
MSTLLTRDDRTVLSLNQHEVEQARQFTQAAPTIQGAIVVAGDSDGSQGTAMPSDLVAIMRQVLEVVSRGGTVTVGTVPDELTTTAAAKLLGISRPTLMKLIAQGAIEGHKVGSHTRVKSDNVMSYKEAQRRSRLAAFEEVRDLEDELGLDED